MSKKSDSKYLKGPFKADFRGGYVFSGPENLMFAQVRGWGQLQYRSDAGLIQDSRLQFMVDALNEKASEALKKAVNEIADLSHPEFGKIGRLQEEIHDLKKEVVHWKQARESAMAAGEILKTQLDEHKKEVDWLTFYKREVYQCLGSGSDDVNKFIRDAYVKEKGIGGVPEKLRKEYLDYEADHKGDLCPAQ